MPALAIDELAHIVKNNGLTMEQAVQIQIRSDNHINVNDARATELKEIVMHSLRHCSSQITRVEMHLSDVNGAKAGEKDKGCTMEVRMERRKPMAATEEADTVGESVKGAADKLARMVKNTLERSADKRPPAPEPADPED